MCFICEGGSYDEMRTQIDDAIESRHCYVMSVAGDDRPSWSYTIGLTELFGHPELVVVGGCDDCATRMLRALEARVSAGERLAAGDGPIDLGLASPVRVGSVDPAHWRTDRFAMWCWYYGEQPWESPPASALQALFVTDDGFWQDDEADVLRDVYVLDGPPVFGLGAGPRPNRAHRRAAARHNRRARGRRRR
jgi:hypothetical protein